MRTNVRPDPTPFLGRSDELRVLEAGGGPGTVRIVVGPGGVGKTRLVTEYTAPLALSGRETWFVGLAGVDGPRGVAVALADVLGAGGAADPVAAVGDLLGDRPVLVVLDNVEHVAGPVAALITEIRARAPQCEWLLTGRSPTGLPDERPLLLGPLASDDAIALFTRSAAAARRGFGRPDDPALVARLVARLDHLPLGIELAAARADRLTLTDLLAIGGELQDPRREQRHVSLDAVVAWSWDHLEPMARADLSAVSVFRGPFDLRGAAAVLDDDPAGTIRRVDRLVEASLVRSVPLADGAPGFAVYAAVRAFVVREAPPCPDPWIAWLTERAEGELFVEGDLLDQAQRAASRDRADLVALLDEPVAPVVAARALLRVAARIPAAFEHDDLMDRIDTTSARLADRPILQAALGWVGGLRARGAGALVDAIERYDRARTGAAGHRIAIRAAIHCAVAQGERGEHTPARQTLETALHGATHPADRMHAQVALGVLANTTRDTTLAREVLPSAIAIADDIGAWQMAAQARAHLAQAIWWRGELSTAEQLLRDALPELDRAGAPVPRSWCRTLLAGLFHQQDRIDEARQHLLEALPLALASGEPLRAGIVHRSLALIAQATGRLDAAVAELAAADVRIGQHAPVRVTIEGIRAEVLLELGDLAGAARAIDRGLEMAHEPVARAKLTAWRGVVRIRAGEVEAGVRDLDTAAEMPEVSVLRVAELLVGGRTAEARDRVERATEPVAARIVGRWIDDATRWSVAADGTWFVVDGTRVALGGRAVLARLLHHLVDRRLASPGEALPPDALIGAGWPGERIQAEAAANRLYVALSTLRKLGLGDRVERVEGGWRLDPRAPVTVG